MPNERNEVIRARYAEGEALSDLASIFDLSPQRIFQIVNYKQR
jgi:Mor family transcriptional regulator